MNEEKGSFFNDREHDNMIMAVAEGQGEFHEDDVTKLSEWIVKVNIDKGVADMVLNGILAVDTRGVEFVFRKKEKS